MTFIKDMELKMNARTLLQTFVVIIVIGLLLGLVHLFLAAMIPTMIMKILDIIVIGGIVLWILLIVLRAVGVKI